MHRSYFRSACSLICAALVASCDAFLAADGRVVDASGIPIEGALVHLTWGRERGRSDTSDARGRFVLGHAHGLSWPNRGTLTVCKTGYQQWRTDFGDANMTLAGLEVRMTRDP